METTHTPGPWGLRHSGKTVVSLPHTSPEAREVIACSIENTANARLIAAAPELLQALEQFLEMDDGQLLYGPMFNETVRSAITRATQP